MSTSLRPVTAASPSPARDRTQDPPAPEQLLDVTAYAARPGALVLSVRGEIDLYTSPLLRELLLAQLPRAARLVVINLTEVDFLGAAGLTVLLTVRTRAQAAGTHLRVVTGAPLVRWVLSAAGLLTVLDVRPDLAHALPPAGGPPHFV
ncbi:STAS domain-containing protein [Crossiella cryophila]|uniref:Anti-sigma factor antagonist n=1 Tax=Crossiella cryophila TaxID=43355 RepID=A0A7W7CC12_9PSEU|nr:STAS domain-containing protein [Crossiella cryophila]MBB4678415.1 anti-anti-sigma factor [Crossiella cryophila]